MNLQNKYLFIFIAEEKFFLNKIKKNHMGVTRYSVTVRNPIEIETKIYFIFIYIYIYKYKYYSEGSD